MRPEVIVMVKVMFKATATILLLAPFVVAQPARLLQAQQTNPDGKVFAYAFGNEEGGSYLGVGPRDVTPERVGPLKLREETGVEVVTVDADAPAAKAGVREHDVILTINGTKMESVTQLRRVIRETPQGRAVDLGISRDGQLLNITVQLGERPQAKTWAGLKTGGKMPLIPQPPVPPSIWPLVTPSLGVGMVMESLTPQFAEFLGVKNGSGALIRQVDPDTPAAKAGLHAGDVVVSVDKDPVHESSDLYSSLRAKRGSTVTLGVIRDKHEIKLSLAIPERHTGRNLAPHQPETWSQEVPDVDIEMPDMEDLNTAIAMVGPEVEQATKALLDSKGQLELVRPQVEKAMRDARPEIDRARKQVQSQKGEIQKQMHDLRNQLNRDLQGLNPGDLQLLDLEADTI